ncbi:MAG: family 20 glycosylhydrolase [Acidobacteriaceae bacterium]|nr:family 20 glycosylhydrolase [Acidobacteriaceae bacterium]
MHGLQTLTQLVTSGPAGFYIPVITIDDQPRFPWRGLMLDCSRHFMPVSLIERTLDGMEAVKLNVFHWHLSDDQGFRAELHSLPKLTADGSDGLFYTREQMLEVIAYAHDRGIRVVPEIDMPGHVSAMLAAYPEFGSGSGPYSIERTWGVFNPALDPTREETYRFIDKIITQITEIFPDAYLHIGGDECNGKEWKTNPRIMRYMQQHGIVNDKGMQAYFSLRVQKIVAKHGKIPLGWEEILQPETAKDVVIQSWHGPKQLLEAARSGHKVILSKGYYLDLNLPAADHYAIDPLPKEALQLTQEQQSNILGGEAAMWTEYVSEENVESRIWPRVEAVAERLWSPREATQDVNDLYRRMDQESPILEAYGLSPHKTYMRMLQRLSNGKNMPLLKTLADVEEPPKQHGRAYLGSYNSFIPLNHMVDAIPPESMLAREFTSLCNQISKRNASPEDLKRARELLTVWKQNGAMLEPTLSQSALTSDLASASAALTDAAKIGLSALNLMEINRKGTPAWQDTSLRSLTDDEKPHATMILAITEPIKVLVRSISIQAN